MASGSKFVDLIGYTEWLSEFTGAAERFGTMGQPTYVVGSDVYYAAHQEYGTYKMPAQPHLRPATDAMRGNIDKYFRSASNPDEALKRAAADLAGDVQRRAPVDSGNLRASYAPPVKIR